MPQARCNLPQRFLRIESDGDIPKLISIGLLDNVRKARRAELQSDVEEIVLSFLIVVSDDVRVIIGFLEDGDFAIGERDKIS